jgi:hypothetical protein
MDSQITEKTCKLREQHKYFKVILKELQTDIKMVFLWIFFDQLSVDVFACSLFLDSVH